MHRVGRPLATKCMPTPTKTNAQPRVGFWPFETCRLHQAMSGFDGEAGGRTGPRPGYATTSAAERLPRGDPAATPLLIGRDMACFLFWRPGQLQSLAGHRSTAGPSHSDVPSQAPSARSSAPTPTHREVVAQMNRAEERAAPEDVGEQALMRGLVTAFPFFRLGLSCSSIGRRSADRPHNGFQEFPCRGPALTPARLMVAVLPPASSCNGGAVGRSSAPTTRAVHSPGRPLCLPISHDLAIDRPNECRQLAGNRRSGDRWPLAFAHK